MGLETATISVVGKIAGAIFDKIGSRRRERNALRRLLRRQHIAYEHDLAALHTLYDTIFITYNHPDTIFASYHKFAFTDLSSLEHPLLQGQVDTYRPQLDDSLVERINWFTKHLHELRTLQAQIRSEFESERGKTLLYDTPPKLDRPIR